MSRNCIEEVLVESNSNLLLEYNHFQIEDIKNKISVLESDSRNMEKIILELDEKDGSKKIKLSKTYIFLKSTLDFYHRVIRAYHFNRLLKIQQSIINNTKSEDLRHMTLSEKEHHTFFENILTEYLEKENISLENHIPPTSFYTHFITLADCGIVMEGDLIYELKENKYFHMKKSLIYHLIGSKYIKILD